MASIAQMKARVRKALDPKGQDPEMEISEDTLPPGILIRAMVKFTVEGDALEHRPYGVAYWARVAEVVEKEVYQEKANVEPEPEPEKDPTPKAKGKQQAPHRGGNAGPKGSKG